MTHEIFRIKYHMLLSQNAEMSSAQRPRYEKLAADTLRRYEQRHGDPLLQANERAA